MVNFLFDSLLFRNNSRKQEADEGKQKIKKGTQMRAKEKLPLGTAIPVRELQNIVNWIVTQQGGKSNEDFLRR